jgi:hypothetical protein
MWLKDFGVEPCGSFLWFARLNAHHIKSQIQGAICYKSATKRLSREEREGSEGSEGADTSESRCGATSRHDKPDYFAGAWHPKMTVIVI